MKIGIHTARRGHAPGDGIGETLGPVGIRAIDYHTGPSTAPMPGPGPSHPPRSPHPHPLPEAEAPRSGEAPRRANGPGHKTVRRYQVVGTPCPGERRPHSNSSVNSIEIDDNYLDGTPALANTGAYVLSRSWSASRPRAAPWRRFEGRERDEGTRRTAPGRCGREDERVVSRLLVDLHRPTGPPSSFPCSAWEREETVCHGLSR